MKISNFESMSDYCCPLCGKETLLPFGNVGYQGYAQIEPYKYHCTHCNQDVLIKEITEE